MPPKNLKKMVFSGISTGLLASAFLSADENTTSSAANTSLLKSMESAEGGNYGYHIMTEDDLMLELTPEGAKIYNDLTPEGKRLALIVASGRCDHQNECKYLNSCKTDTNNCAGQSANCKHTGKCAFATKDLAVKTVAAKMARQRAEAAGVNNAEQKSPQK